MIIKLVNQNGLENVLFNMKRKILIKEGELENLVKMTLKEFKDPYSIDDQLELDFPNEEANSIIEMLTENYDEIIIEIGNILSNCESVDCGEELNKIHEEKIFPIWQHIYKVSNNNLILDKFNELEDIIIDYIELSRESKKLNDELEETKDDLNNLINRR